MGLITTEGFKDLMEIGWQRRPSLYDLRRPKPEQLIPPGMNQEVKERILHDGSILTPLDEDSVRNAVRFLKEMGAETIAVCTLFSFINPVHEDRIKEIIPTIAGALVCRGIARKVAGFVPALGWLVKGGMGYLGTLAIGEAALTYFEQGGSIAGVAGMLSQAGNAASDAAMKIRNQRAYQVVSDAAGPVARRAASKAVGVAGDVAQSALKGAMDYRKRNRGAKN